MKEPVACKPLDTSAGADFGETQFFIFKEDASPKLQAEANSYFPCSEVLRVRKRSAGNLFLWEFVASEKLHWYQRYFDMTPLINQENKTMEYGYKDKPKVAAELRERVLEYLFNSTGRTDSSAANHVRNLLARGFFTAQSKDASHGVNLAATEKILNDYLKLQCNDGAKRAKKFLGYIPTEKKWVETEMTVQDLYDTMYRYAGFEFKSTPNSYATISKTKNPEFYENLGKMPIADMQIKIWVEEEVEV